MSDRPIQVGDLVQVVRPLGCCPSISIGWIFIVQKIETYTVHCQVCKTVFKEGPLAYSGDYYIPLWRLKRIPPLLELEGVLAQNEIKRPLTKEPA